MADIVLTIDPDDTSFALHDRANGRRLMGFDAPVPETDSQWAFSADTEGERRANLRYRNRIITAEVLLDRSTAVLLEALENTLGQKIGKLAREGGELRLTYPSGNALTFNVLEASMNRTFDIADMAKFRARYEISFICEPYGLGTEVDMGDNTETTLPVLIFTETGILGDVPGLGRLVIDNDVLFLQWWMTWGIQSRYYSSSANAALFYEAEGRTALGGSATAAGPTGASGGGSNVMRNTVLPSTSYIAILSTRATGGGAHLSHVGTFRIYARVQVPTANTGEVTLALEWSDADFLRSSTNAATTIPTTDGGKWRLVDLGLVAPRVLATGTQQWEGRIIAKSSVAGDDVDIDYLMLVPVSEGSGIASAVTRDVTPTSFLGQDSFTSTTSGNALNTRVAPTGGTWATSGAATDFAFYDTDGSGLTGEGVQRSTTADASHRFAILGSTNYSDVGISVRAQYSTVGSGLITQGLVARWTDSSNYIRVSFQHTSANVHTLEIRHLLAGVSTVFATSSDWPSGVTVAGGFWEIRSIVDSSGVATAQVVSLGSTSGSGAPAAGTVMMSVTGQSSVWATGGVLADGEPGFLDINTTASGRRDFDDFYVWVPPLDAVAFLDASLEVRHDRVHRESENGATWAPVSSYEGDYLYVPPAGAESRTSRVIVKMTRNDPFQLDPAIDDLSARLFVTPRFLVVPDV